MVKGEFLNYTNDAQSISLDYSDGFYRSKEGCMSCGAVGEICNDIIGEFRGKPDSEYGLGGNFDYCFYKKQPETDDEKKQAFLALEMCCTRNHRYGGSDSKIIEKLMDKGLTNQLDNPLKNYVSVKWWQFWKKCGYYKTDNYS